MSDVWTPPRAEVKDIGLSGNPDAPEIRQQHLNHEANIKALGTLSYLGFVIMTLGGIAKLLTGGGTGRLAAYSMGMGIAFIVLGLLYFWIGRGLRALKPWSRIVAGVLAGIGLLGFPIGTLISGFILYLLFSKKGAMVFSDEYKQIIADTPDIKYRTSIIVWIFLGLLIAAAAFVVIAVTLRH